MIISKICFKRIFGIQSFSKSKSRNTKNNNVSKTGALQPDSQKSNINELVGQQFQCALVDLGIEINTQQNQRKPLNNMDKMIQFSQIKPKAKEYVNRLKKIKQAPTMEAPNGPIIESFLEKIKSTEELKKRRSDYQIQQYERGEFGVDVIPVEQVFGKKVQNAIKEIELERQNVKQMFNADNYNPVENASKIRKYKQEYAAQYKQHELEEFNRVVQKYPGSRRGPLPQDDPENFRNYIKNKVPISMLKELDMQLQDENQNKHKDIIHMESHNVQDYMSENTNRQEFLNPETLQEYYQQNFILEDPQMIPVLPEFQYRGYQELMQNIFKWTCFRNQYLIHNTETNLHNIFQRYKYASRNQTRTKIGSLYSYYKALPTWLQQHPGVKDVYLGLEYYSPDWKINEKERALNYAAYLALPLDILTNEMFEKHNMYNNDRYYPVTPFEVNKILTMKPEFTWDVEEFMNELEEEKLRGEKQVQTTQQMPYPRPDYVTQKPEQPNLPIDFYDNQDGFWDDYISQKLRIFDEVPMLNHRPYLKH